MSIFSLADIGFANTCHLLFDAAQVPFNWTPVWEGIVVIGLSLICVYTSRQLSGVLPASPITIRGLAICILAIASVLTVVNLSIWQHTEGSSAPPTQVDPEHIVEGPVADFHPMPPAGHDWESFTVQGVRFALSDYFITGGFNHSSTKGGPLRSGLNVRIAYIEDGPEPQDHLILRLEDCS